MDQPSITVRYDYPMFNETSMNSQLKGLALMATKTAKKTARAAAKKPARAAVLNRDPDSEQSAQHIRVQKALWLQDHRGIIGQIAEQTGKSQPYVSMVYKGQRRNAAIEKALRKAGAPA